MTEQDWVIDTVPGTAFPVYTRLNANDVLAGPITPLGASAAWIPHIIPGWSMGYVASGAFSVEEVARDLNAPAGFFYGHLYVNMTLPRLIGVRLGIGAEGADAAFFNDHPERPPHVPGPGDVNEELSAKMAERASWALTTGSFPELDEQRDIADRCRAERPDLRALSSPALVARARSVLPLQRLMWQGEVIATNSAAVGPGVVRSIVDPIDPALTVALIGHAGDVDSAAPTFALWDLSRRVRRSEALTAEFSQGPEHVLSRLDGLEPGFVTAFRRFLREFGYRGPDEWDLGSPSWETRPELALALIDRLRVLDEDAGPEARSRATQAAAATALAEVTAKIDDPEALATLRTALGSARRFGAWRERAKSNCIKVLHEARVALDEVARRLYAEGRLDDPAHLFMAVDDELDVLVADPEPLRAELAERYARWRSLEGLELPTFVDGRSGLAPLASLRRRAAVQAGKVEAGEVLRGEAASAGRARGRARIVLDASGADALEPGEILVAPNTDPSWTPLFMVSAGVVVDVGAMGSHAMIVGRELGVPCVAGVGQATVRIPDGALLEVDGAAGTVTVLEP